MAKGSPRPLRFRDGAIQRLALSFALAGAYLFAPAAFGLTAQRVASGLTQPVYVTAPPGDTTHIYIVQQTGRIMRLDLQTGQLTTFFTIGGLTSTSGEQGLLGLAFDPNYATNHKFYLNFTVPRGAFGNRVTHISQFQAPSAALTQESLPQVSAAPEENPRTNRRRRRRFPTPTPTATPTPTSTPTATPRPTPPATPSPTATPRPTATP